MKTTDNTKKRDTVSRDTASRGIASRDTVSRDTVSSDDVSRDDVSRDDVSRDDVSSMTDDEKKKRIKYMRDKDREMVKGIFRFYEVPGGTMSFNFRKYKGDPITRYDFADGGIYTIPRGVAKHLVNNGKYPVHKHLQDESGKVSVRVGQSVSRFGFESLEFVDGLTEDTSELVIVDMVSDDTSFRKI